MSKGPHFSFKLVSSHESNAGFGIINLLLEISLIDRLKLRVQDRTIPNQSNSFLIMTICELIYNLYYKKTVTIVKPVS